MAPEYATIYEVSILFGGDEGSAGSFRKASTIKLLRKRIQSVRTLAAPLVSRESNFDLAHRFSTVAGLIWVSAAAVSRRSPVVVIETLRSGSAQVQAPIAG